MNLVRFDKVTLEYGEQVLLRDADFALESGERVCLMGRNGAGKTSSFKLIMGDIEPDRGSIEIKPGLRVATLHQALPMSLEYSVHDFVCAGLTEIQQWRDEYDHLASGALGEADLKRLESLQHNIDALGGWQLEQRVDAMITALNLPPTKRLSELSAGWRRRVALANALISNPELLLLDEPTNHLDFATIEWLEQHVIGFGAAVLFISHDRSFVTRVASRIVELDRGQLTSWPGDYERFLTQRDKAREEEQTRDALFDKKLAEEEAWIREGIKARRTRNQGRVRALQSLRGERAQRMKLQASANMQIDAADPSGRKVIELKNVGLGYDERPLFEALSLKVRRGDRIGIVGNNGVGKSTLVRVMLGEQQPDSGVVKLGTNLEIGYFDPINTQLPDKQSVADYVGEGREFIDVGGKSRHIISYLNAFLFSAKRARTRLGSLSGGERNRVLLARVFSKPSNLLVLDEPTNDLDVETLEVLEERLVDYDGTLLIVSHDRTFIDNVVTSLLVFEADRGVREYVGGYSDWLRRDIQLLELDNPNKTQVRGEKPVAALKQKPKSRKLSYKLQRELDDLPDRIEQLEVTVQALQLRSAAPDFYTQPYTEVQSLLAELSHHETSLDDAMNRWAELESMRSEFER